ADADRLTPDEVPADRGRVDPRQWLIGVPARQLGKDAQVLDRHWNIDEGGLAERSPKVTRLDLGELSAALLDRIGDRVQDAGALVRWCVRPWAAVEGG